MSPANFCAEISHGICRHFFKTLDLSEKVCLKKVVHELCELLVGFKPLLRPAVFANALKFVVSNIAKHFYILLQKKNYL